MGSNGRGASLQKIGIVPARHVGMGAQAAFQHVGADIAEQRIVGSLAGPRASAASSSGRSSNGMVASSRALKKNGTEIRSTPASGVIGDCIELASNGISPRRPFIGCVTPLAGVERISVPFFFSARLDATIPLLDLPEELAAEARGPASDPDNPLFRNVAPTC